MAEKKISYETEGNHWYWRAANPLDCQTGTLVTMPEDGKITRLEFKVGGLDYSDPVYGYQYHKGLVKPTIWDRHSGAVLSTGSLTSLPISKGGSMPWVSFNIPDLTVKKGRQIIVGFWRRSSSTGYATQWDYNNSAADGQVTFAHHAYPVENGPMSFKVSQTYMDRAINFRMYYQSGGAVKVWNGSSWAVKKAKVWNGSSWVDGVVQAFDGSTWNESGS